MRATGPVIAVHGGAGTFARIRRPSDVGVLLAVVDQALAAGWAVLESGGDALDAVVEAVAVLETSGRFNAGRGAVPTTAGRVEFDASVMEVRTGAVGALCAATHPANPVRAARAIAAAGGLPNGPVLLAGEGADRFCEEAGLEKMRPEWLTAFAGDGDGDAPAVVSDKGTVGAVALDATGNLAAATSTGGRAGQRPGRVGDSPIPGAGVLADRSGLALSATGTGEVFLVTGFAHEAAAARRAGRTLAEAVAEALGHVGELGGEGGAVAVDADGEVVAAFTTPAMARGWRSAAGAFAALEPTARP